MSRLCLTLVVLSFLLVSAHQYRHKKCTVRKSTAYFNRLLQINFNHPRKRGYVISMYDCKTARKAELVLDLKEISRRSSYRKLTKIFYGPRTVSELAKKVLHHWKHKVRTRQPKNATRYARDFGCAYEFCGKKMKTVCLIKRRKRTFWKQ